MLATRSTRCGALACRFALVFPAAALLLLAVPPAGANQVYWATSSGDWSSQLSWASDDNGWVHCLPTISDDAYIPGGIAYVTTAGDVCKMLYLDGTVLISGGDLTVAGRAYVGNAGTGIISQSAGTNDSGSVSLANSAGSSGFYYLNGGLLSTQFETVGNNGTATFTQTAGMNIATSTLGLGENAGASGTYTLNTSNSGQGQLSASLVFVGVSGTGNFTQSGGTSTGWDLDLAFSFSGSGTYSLYGGLLSEGNAENIGVSGTATFSQSGGTNTVSGSGYSSYWTGSTVNVGCWAGSVGTYNFSAGSLSVIGDENIGNYGTGIFNQSGGTNTITGTLTVGYWESSGVGTYNLSGGLLSVSSNEDIGRSGRALFQQTGGTNSISASGCLYVGGTNTIAAYSLSGAGLLSAPCEFLANADTGSFTQSGGTNSIYSYQPNYFLGGGYYGLILGHGLGTYSLSGGSLAVLYSEIVGADGTGIFNQSGGANTITGSNGPGLVVDAWGYVNSSATYNLSGGKLLATNEYVGDSGTGTFTQSGGTNSISGCLYLGYNRSGTYNLNGTGGLSAPNEYIGYSGTGTFNQSGGTNTIASGGALYLGYHFIGSGTYTLSKPGLLYAQSDEIVGYGGTGTFTQSGGTNTIAGSGALYVGYGTDENREHVGRGPIQHDRHELPDIVGPQ